MNDIQNQQTLNTIVKELKKIGKKDNQALTKILVDMDSLELAISSGKPVEQYSLSVKVIIIGKEKVMQLTSGKYRVWYRVMDGGIVEYLKIFKKEKNSTPKRFKDSIPKLIRKSVSAENVDVKSLIRHVVSKEKEPT